MLILVGYTFTFFCSYSVFLENTFYNHLVSMSLTIFEFSPAYLKQTLFICWPPLWDNLLEPLNAESLESNPYSRTNFTLKWRAIYCPKLEDISKSFQFSEEIHSIYVSTYDNVAIVHFQKDFNFPFKMVLLKIVHLQNTILCRFPCLPE